VHSYREA